MTVIARYFRASGLVQGVGFRPFVWRLAHELQLTGWVRNDGRGVEIHAEGGVDALMRFAERLRDEAPRLACVDSLLVEEGVATGLADFVILDSGAGPTATLPGPDVAPCADCLAELFDPNHRRWRHAFINCTQCGPRYSVTKFLPYDRAWTSLAEFSLCADCAREYDDPADRRFHAEGNCCPQCGPRLSLREERNVAVTADDPLAAVLVRLRRGEIVALKGVGGYQLLCDARNAAAVARLRVVKGRDAKPLAVMVANVASAREFVEVDPNDAALLESIERPIVLLRKRDDAVELLTGVAPDLAWLGVLLPASPLHYLLFHEAVGRPAGITWLKNAQTMALVCTSANPGGEPLLADDAQVMDELQGSADVFLTHDRAIVARCDDSVLRPAADGVCFVRRARGWVPRAIRLAHDGPSVLALGGYLKNTICVTRGNESFVSAHIGALDNAASCAFLEETVTRLLDLLDVQPEIVAHDLHPDFHSTRFAAEFAVKAGVARLPVQHHHAHIAAVLAEHGYKESVIGLALDGVGLGEDREGRDGTAWGGELLRVEGAACERLGHALPLLMPGGDRAAREPWRMAAAALQAIGRGDEIVQRYSDVPAAAAATVAGLLARGEGPLVPSTSSAGRVFDAAAALLNVCRYNRYEGEAALWLESLAQRHGDVASMAQGWRIDDHNRLDLRPLYGMLADCREPAFGAAVFHATLAAGLADWAGRAARRSGITTVACGGGCFLNGVLVRQLAELLARQGLRVLLARQMPPNDGGLSLGQAWVARLASL